VTRTVVWGGFVGAFALCLCAPEYGFPDPARPEIERSAYGKLTWQAFAGPGDPFVIGILGTDPFGARLDEAVLNEQINGHPLTVRRFRTVAEVENCQILFVDRSEAAHLGQILAALDHRSTLTVSQADGAAQRGVMIQFATENNRIRLRINVESARASGLTISSKLLRPAEIVGTERE